MSSAWFSINPAFEQRVRDSMIRLRRGEDAVSIRERHGCVVVEEARLRIGEMRLPALIERDDAERRRVNPQ